MVIDLLRVILETSSLSKSALAPRIGIHERTIDRHIADPAKPFQGGTLKLIKEVVIEQVANSDLLSIAEQEYLLDGILANVNTLASETHQKMITGEIELARERLRLRKERNTSQSTGDV